MFFNEKAIFFRIALKFAVTGSAERSIISDGEKSRVWGDIAVCYFTWRHEDTATLIYFLEVKMVIEKMKSIMMIGIVGFIAISIIVMPGCSIETNQKQIKEQARGEVVEISDDELAKIVHLDDVTDIPKYRVELYKKGDKMPAANGNTMNCTYLNCYKVVFDIPGSGQSPTDAFKSLEKKLQDRAILDASYQGADLPTISVNYWTNEGGITARFYK